MLCTLSLYQKLAKYRRFRYPFQIDLLHPSSGLIASSLKIFADGTKPELHCLFYSAGIGEQAEDCLAGCD